MFIYGGQAAKFSEHHVRLDERRHLEAAAQFVRERELVTGAIPEPNEFDAWANAMDSNKRYRFGGLGYTLDKRCGSKPSDYCISYWTGDAWATYRSWQSSMDTVAVNDSSFIPVAIYLAGALGMAIVSVALLRPTSTKTLHGEPGI
jgi:hypothetical protein